MSNKTFKSNLSDEQLIKACSEWIMKLCQSNGNAWNLNIPPDEDRDPDILFTELLFRFEKKNIVLNHINTISHV